MTSPVCTRCGASFEPRRANDRRCRECEAAVERLIASDTARRTRVVWRPGDVTPYSGRRAA